MNQPYDLLIIGGGPIGIACGLEAKKAGLKYLILEKGCLVNSLYRPLLEFPRIKGRNSTGHILPFLCTIPYHHHITQCLL